MHEILHFSTRYLTLGEAVAELHESDFNQEVKSLRLNAHYREPRDMGRVALITFETHIVHHNRRLVPSPYFRESSATSEALGDRLSYVGEVMARASPSHPLKFKMLVLRVRPPGERVFWEHCLSDIVREYGQITNGVYGRITNGGT